jgi:protein phosphatase
VRKNNEDSGFTASVKVSSKGVSKVYRVVGVADGAGGHEYGELASSEAVLEFLGVLLPGLAEREKVPDLIREGFEAANRRVLELIREKGATMASTLSVAVVEGSAVHVGHAGDSRLYAVSGGRVQRLTTDHKPPTGPRNVITNALGLPSMWVELHAGAESYRLAPGGILLAATDGLTELVDDGEIFRVASSRPLAPLSICRELINLANTRGGYDNVTVAVMAHLT